MLPAFNLGMPEQIQRAGGWGWGMKDFAKSFYNSKRWSRCRDAYIAERQRIDGGMCEECRERIGVIVHHRVILTAENIDNPEISLNHKLLELVCHECHDEFPGHGVGKSLTPRVIFDADGNPLPPVEKLRSTRQRTAAHPRKNAQDMKNHFWKCKQVMTNGEKCDD